MKICYIIPSNMKFGPTLVACDLAKLMVERGHEVVVYYFDNTNSSKLDFPCYSKKIFFWKSIDFSQFDIVHTHGLRPDAYVYFHKKKNGRTRYITTIHNFVEEDLRTTYNSFVSLVFSPIWMFLLRRHDMRVALSQTAMTYYYKWFQKEQITFVYNTRVINNIKDLSEDEINELLIFKGSDKLIGVNAGHDMRKGADQLIKALKYLDNTKLFVFWRGQDRQDLRALAKEFNVEHKIFFAGYREDAYRYQKYFDTFVIPSRSEGFPLALLEALSLKSNIVCSNLPIFKEFLNDDQVTFFKLEDINSLVSAIDYSFQNNKSEKSYLRYIKTFSPNIIAEKYMKIYENI